MSSLRGALSAGLLLVGAVLLALALAGTYALANDVLLRQFERGLFERATALATLLEQRGEEVELHFSDEVLPRYAMHERPEYFQLWRGERELERSVSLALRPGASLPRPVPAAGETVFLELALPDGRAGRLVAHAFAVHHYAADAETGADPGPAEILVVVAVERRELDAAVRRLLVGMFALGLALLVLLVVLGRRVLDAGLRPLVRLADVLGRIERQESSLAALQDLPLPRELAPIRARIAALTQSLEDSLERERRTSAHLAHELRTPVAELRATAEVALQSPDDGPGAQQALGDARAIALDMQEKIASLLALARARAAAPLPRETRDLLALVRPLWESARANAERRGLVWSLRSTTDLPPVLVHAPAVSTVLCNLFDNAAGHGDATHPAECVLEADAREVRVLVQNGAARLTPADLARLGEPFWRAEGSDARAAHSGLGLALAAECARAAGLTLSFRLDSGLLTATLAIPRA